MDAKEKILFYMENDVLISPDLIEELSEPLPVGTKHTVLDKNVLSSIKNSIALNIDDYENALVLKQKHRNPKVYEKFREYLAQQSVPVKHDVEEPPSIQEIIENIPKITLQQTVPTPEDFEAQKKNFLKENNISIISDYNEKSHKRTVYDFVNHFNSRYKDIERILRSRQELQNTTSISRINAKREKDNVAMIGFVYEKGLTKNNNIMFTIEDPTGFIKVVVTQNKEDLYALAQEIQLDEVIGITGMYDKLVFANSILLPDIPLTKELKKSPAEGYFVVISDPQVGNKLFLEKEFHKFIAWMNGGVGSDVQRDIASKIKYLFIVGDLVDGVGIYPDQEYDLNIIDIKDQYKQFSEYIKLLPSSLPIIICPGNHDVGRISDPQPAFRDGITRPVWGLHNVITVSSPSIINIFQQEGFEGFDVLLYHGFSFFYYFENVPSIRQKGRSKRVDLVMKYLLQRRHLAPSHTSTLYIPDAKKDPLTLDKVPDFFFSGHVHRASVNNYRNVTCINASCWVSKSEEQERRGLEPQPGRAFIINMQTREVKVMNFLSKEEQEKEDG